MSKPFGQIVLYATDKKLSADQIAFEFNLETGQSNTNVFQKIFECEGHSLSTQQELLSQGMERETMFGRRLPPIPMIQSNTIEFSGFSHMISAGLEFDIDNQGWQIIILTCLHGILILHEPWLIEISRQFQAGNKLFIELTLQCFELDAYPVEKKQESSPFDIEIGPRSALPSGEFDIEIEKI